MKFIRIGTYCDINVDLVHRVDFIHTPNLVLLSARIVMSLGATINLKSEHAGYLLDHIDGGLLDHLWICVDTNHETRTYLFLNTLESIEYIKSEVKSKDIAKLRWMDGHCEIISTYAAAEVNIAMKLIIDETF